MRNGIIFDTTGTARVVGEALVPILEAVYERACALGLTRVRGGNARGAWWAELAGRVRDGGWIEIRLHHRAGSCLMQAGALCYDPLARGGRTRVLAETSHTYLESPSEAIPTLVAMLARVLADLEPEDA